LRAVKSRAWRILDVKSDQALRRLRRAQRRRLSLDEGERLGLIGPNGSGKTTMINCISGALFCDQGAITFKGADVTRLAAHRRTRRGIVRSFPIPRPFRSMTVLQNLLIPMEYAASHSRHQERARDPGSRRFRNRANAIRAAGGGRPG
jgi:ABC-type branched-subunit amino acid transport system ATPase component